MHALNIVNVDQHVPQVCKPRLSDEEEKKTPDLMKRLSLCQPLLAGANLLSHLAATTSIVTTSQASMLSWGRIQKERKIKRKPRVFARVVAAAGSTLLTKIKAKTGASMVHRLGSMGGKTKAAEKMRKRKHASFYLSPKCAPSVPFDKKDLVGARLKFPLTKPPPLSHRLL